MSLNRFVFGALCGALAVGTTLAACAPVTAPPTASLEPAATETAAPTAVSAPTQMPAPTAVDAPTPRPFSAVKLSSAALAANLIGDPGQGMVYVYLPPTYNVLDKRYPVLYYLPGYSDSGMLGFTLPDDMDALINGGAIQDLILVVVPGVNSVGGSFYVNSPVTGDWEDFVVQEVVGYVDSHYRTLARAESRGLSGHSMGGFGAFNLAMRHPDVFGAVYSLSPGLFDPDGLAESQMFASPSGVQAFVDVQRDILAQPADQAKYALYRLDAFTVAYGYAFAPAPAAPPFYFDYPYAEGEGGLVRDEAVWARWEAGFGGLAEKVQVYKANLLKLRGLAIDYGDDDGYAWIPKGCQYLEAQLTAAGIPHQVESYPGGHQDQLGVRIREHMLPFFSHLLVGQ